MPDVLAKTAFDNMLALIQDAISVADDALAITGARAHTPEPAVTLTKVASHTASRVASALVRTGAFPEWKTADLAARLQSASPSDCVELLEKLASRAMFPLVVSDDLRGDLVDKPANQSTVYDKLPPHQAIWQRARDEAVRELRS